MPSKQCVVINLFGEPGVGKSALASYIHYRLKVMGYNCEVIREFAKDLVYEENENALGNQTYIFGEQLQMMNRVKNKVDIIIAESPIILSGLYMRDKDRYYNFFNLVYDTFQSYNNYNFLLSRTHEYVQDGRIQDEEGAKKIRNELITSLNHYKIPYDTVISTQDHPDTIFHNDGGEYIINTVICDLKTKGLIDNSDNDINNSNMNIFNKVKYMIKDLTNNFLNICKRK